MDYKSAAVGAIGVLLVLSMIGGAYAVGAGSAPTPETNTSAETTTTTTTQEPVDPNEAPEEVQASYEGAKQIQKNLQAEGYNDARVFVSQNGEVVVKFNSDASNGPELKDDMSEIAFLYSDVIADHPDMGGLTVRANGVMLLVSSDTAIAHSEDRLKDDAYEKTFVYKSAPESQTTSTDN